MTKIWLLVAGLVFLSCSVFAGEVITNDTGEEATAFRVAFSTPVLITAFGDVLTSVDPQMLAFEFVFSGGIVEPWGSHWMNWAPSTAQIIEHQWLTSVSSGNTSAGASAQDTSFVLSRTTTTRFPLLNEDADTDDLPALIFSSSLLSQYAADADQQLQPIDGFSPGSNVPLDSWYSSSMEGDMHTTNHLTPSEESPDSFVRYEYPADGNVGYVALQYLEPVDLSGFEGLRIIASADHPVEIEVVVGICDDAIPPSEVCGESAALFSIQLSLKQETQVFILPFDQFEIHSYILENNPTASLAPQFHGVFDMIFRPNDDMGVIEIHEVSAVAQVVVSENEPPVINDDYFQHPAYVMQGVDDLDAIYALPLEGIPELGTGHVTVDPDSDELSWTVTTSDPGIGAGFQNETLYIWGSAASWSGYGEAIVSVADADGKSDSITIPVTVFREDKTMINGESKKDYFVPWSPELDINRILSVEEHLRTYDKDEGDLDRFIQWSHWKKMWQLRDVTKSNFWYTSDNGWNWSAQRRLIDVLLNEFAEMGVGLVRIENPYFISTRSGTDVRPVYEYVSGNAGVTMAENEISYFVNELHRLGMQAMLCPFVGIDIRTTNGEFFEIWQALDRDLNAFWDSYSVLVQDVADTATDLGVEIVSLVDSLLVGGTRTTATCDLANARISSIASAVRHGFKGPLTATAGKINDDFPDYQRKLADASSFWGDLDIISTGVFDGWRPLAPIPNATLEQMVSGWESVLSQYIQPFQAKWNKPFIAYENGCYASTDGARWSGFGYVLGTLGDNPGVDIDQMRIYYESYLQVFSHIDWHFGPGWYFYNFNQYGLGGVHDIDMVPRLKVDDIIQRGFTGAYTPRIVLVDGSVSEWQEDWIIAQDSPQDRTSGDDLEIVWAVTDDKYLYVRVDYSNPPQGGLRILIDVDSDEQADYRLGAWASWIEWQGTQLEYWNGDLARMVNPSELQGRVDVARDGNSLEMRVHRLLLDDLDESVCIRVIEYHDRPWRVEDSIEGWHIVPVKAP